VRRQVYCNYQDGLLDGEGTLPKYTDAYFASNLRRLQQLKAVFDPRDVFTFPQSIPRAKLRDEL